MISLTSRADKMQIILNIISSSFILKDFPKADSLDDWLILIMLIIYLLILLFILYMKKHFG